MRGLLLRNRKACKLILLWSEQIHYEMEKTKNSSLGHPLGCTDKKHLYFTKIIKYEEKYNIITPTEN